MGASTLTSITTEERVRIENTHNTHRGISLYALFVFFVVSLSIFSLEASADPSTVTVWSENPWIDTAGGTSKPTPDIVSGSEWSITMLMNDTEQMMIGLINTLDTAQDITVSIKQPASFNAGKAELLAVGAITSQRATGVNPNNAALVNLFTKAQLASFNGNFPPSFVGVEAWKDFPTLHLSPNEPVRLWFRVRTYDGDVPGTAWSPAGIHTFRLIIHFGDGSEIAKDISVNILHDSMWLTMPLEVLVYGGNYDGTYGGYSEVIDQIYHTTVNGSYTNFTNKKKYVFRNLLIYSGSRLDLNSAVSLYHRDSAEFERKIAAAVDAYYARLHDLGWKEEQVMISIIDEPLLAHLEGFSLIARAVKAYKPDSIIYANPYVKNLALFQALDPYVDVWSPQETIFQSSEIMSFLKKTGKPLWFYNNLYGEGSRDERALLKWFRRGGWTAVYYKLDGMGFWSAHFVYGDMWDDFDAATCRRSGRPCADAVLIYPTSSAGPIITRGYEAWRESVEDVVLYEKIKEAYKNGSIREEMQSIAKAWIDNSPNDSITTYLSNPDVVIRIRKDAWDIIRSYCHTK